MSTYAIDFDGTFTTDPEAFRQIVDLLRVRGHTVLFVTQRCKQYESDIEKITGPLSIFSNVVYANGQTKEGATLRAGYSVDVWIEDNVRSVVTPLSYRGCP
jgi:hypothetical protein